MARSIAEVNGSTITLTYEAEIPSQNRLWHAHWNEKYKDKEKWRLLTKAAMSCAGILGMKAKGFRWVTVTSVRKRKCRDIANLVGGAKGMIDALVKFGLLEDDSDDLCHIEYKQETAGKDRRPHTIVTICDKSPVNIPCGDALMGIFGLRRSQE